MFKKNIKKYLMILLSILILFTLWHIFYKLENHEVIIPSITSTIHEVINIITADNFINIIAATTIRAILGFILSLLIGCILGFIAGFKESLEFFMKPYLMIIKSTPIVAIMLIALIWIKSDGVPILVSFLLCYPIIYESVINGIKNTDKSIIEFGKVHKISNFTMIIDVYMPSVFSHIIANIFSTLALSFKTTVSSEIISIPKYGIGNSIYTAKVYLNTAEVFAWLIIIVLLSTIFDVIINAIKNILLKGKVD